MNFSLLPFVGVTELYHFLTHAEQVIRHVFFLPMLIRKKLALCFEAQLSLSIFPLLSDKAPTNEDREINQNALKN